MNDALVLDACPKMKTDINPIISLADDLRFVRSKRELSHHLRKLYEGIDCEGKSLLDIGCGNGLFSIYSRYLGVSKVVGIEPDYYMGMFQRFAKNLSGVELIRSRFQELDLPQFDIVMMHNSLHHLSEWSCDNLVKSELARRDYRSILRKVYDCMKPNGTLIILDASNRNLWADFGIKNPFVPCISWKSHHPPEVYVKLLRGVGFRNPELSWIGPVELPLDSRVGQYFLIGQFRLTMRK